MGSKIIRAMLVSEWWCNQGQTGKNIWKLFWETGSTHTVVNAGISSPWEATDMMISSAV